mmetsp:Transcript_3024/g.6271  ORF Transcript_3024/g.6271 Transcript_3024/m.6271 type:complete len:228 (-) Transcript_3024:135-818(-)
MRLGMRRATGTLAGGLPWGFTWPLSFSPCGSRFSLRPHRHLSPMSPRGPPHIPPRRRASTSWPFTKQDSMMRPPAWSTGRTSQNPHPPWRNMTNLPMIAPPTSLRRRRRRQSSESETSCPYSTSDGPYRPSLRARTDASPPQASSSTYGRCSPFLQVCSPCRCTASLKRSCSGHRLYCQKKMRIEIIFCGLLSNKKCHRAFSYASHIFFLPAGCASRQKCANFNNVC